MNNNPKNPHFRNKQFREDRIITLVNTGTEDAPLMEFLAQCEPGVKRTELKSGCATDR